MTSDPGALLAAAILRRAFADLGNRRYRIEAQTFLSRLREPDNLWGDLLGERCPREAEILAAIQRWQKGLKAS